MAWTVEVTPNAAKQIKKLDKSEAVRIARYLRERIAALDDPRQLGKSLKGSELGQFWRYRIGDYRILCNLQDEVLTVLVVDVGHRKDVYR